MSKIKRYNTFQTMGGVYNDPDGNFLRCSDLIPGTKVTNLEWCEHATDIIKMYMPDDIWLELPDVPDVAALLSEIDKLTTDRNNLLVQVQEAKDKRKVAEAKVQEVTRLDMVQIAMLEGQLGKLMAWKERAIDFMSHEEDDCLLEMMCPKWPLPDPGIDCRPCVEAYFAEDKP
jgi:hypothetical protein